MHHIQKHIYQLLTKNNKIPFRTLFEHFSEILRGGLSRIMTNFAA